MRSYVATGIVAGLIAGAVMGAMMHLMAVPAPDGSRVRMMAMVGEIPITNDPTGELRAYEYDELMVGWIYHLFNSAIIGAILGFLLGPVQLSYGRGLFAGALYGFGWWILGGLMLMPVLLGMPPLAPLAVQEMRILGLASLIGHLAYGQILGAGFVWLYRPGPSPAMATPGTLQRRGV